MDRSENDLNALEARLGSWRPAPASLDRDRMLFLAGRASAGSEMRGRLVAISAVGLAMLAIGLGGLLVSEHGRRLKLERVIAEQVRDVVPSRDEVELVATPALPPAANSYLALSQRFLALAEGRMLPVLASPGQGGSPDRKPPLSPMGARRGEGSVEF
ncbi:MAG: hypothetical protein JWN86_4007 [Planctomycetota bacterium]|nr:hypothetical protein [Planctomycetota bacterium]